MPVSTSPTGPGLAVLVGVGVGVGSGVGVGVAVRVLVGVDVAVLVSVGVAVLVSVDVAVLVGVGVAVNVGVFVGVSVGAGASAVWVAEMPAAIFVACSSRSSLVRPQAAKMTLTNRHIRTVSAFLFITDLPFPQDGG